MKKLKKITKNRLKKLFLLAIVTLIDYGVSYAVGNLVATARINKINTQIIETVVEYSASVQKNTKIDL